MLHLFNKVYLEFDDNIEVGFDRVVISEDHGLPMYQALDKIANGMLLGYAKTYEDIVGSDFVGFLTGLKDHGNGSGKKIIIYCDSSAYKQVLGNYYKLVLPNLDSESFDTLVKHNIYNQRLISNTPFSSVYSTELNSILNDIDSTDLWENISEPTPEDRQTFLAMGANLSYEFLLATFLGDGSRKEEFKNTFHMFARRWWKEVLIDNRSMVLLNISNHKLMEHLSVDTSLIDLSDNNPISNVPELASYADPKIWNVKNNPCKIEGLGVKKQTKLWKTLERVWDYEGIYIDTNQLGEGSKFLTFACSNDIDEEVMEELLNYIINNPFDTCMVPRSDFGTVNFPLLQYFLKLKHNGEDLSNYRLL